MRGTLSATALHRSASKSHILLDFMVLMTRSILGEALRRAALTKILFITI